MPETARKALPQFVVLAVGIWLTAAPAVLGHAGTVLGDSDRLVGPVVAAFAFVAASEITRPLRWVNLLPAGWLLVAPWVLESSTAATINDMVSGAVIAALAPLGRVAMERRFGGGWSSVVKTERLPR